MDRSVWQCSCILCWESHVKTNSKNVKIKKKEWRHEKDIGVMCARETCALKSVMAEQGL